MHKQHKIKIASKYLDGHGGCKVLDDMNPKSFECFLGSHRELVNGKSVSFQTRLSFLMRNGIKQQDGTVIGQVTTAEENLRSSNRPFIKLFAGNTHIRGGSNKSNEGDQSFNNQLVDVNFHAGNNDLSVEKLFADSKKLHKSVGELKIEQENKFLEFCHSLMTRLQNYMYSNISKTGLIPEDQYQSYRTFSNLWLSFVRFSYIFNVQGINENEILYSEQSFHKVVSMLGVSAESFSLSESDNAMGDVLEGIMNGEYASHDCSGASEKINHSENLDQNSYNSASPYQANSSFQQSSSPMIGNGARGRKGLVSSPRHNHLLSSPISYSNRPARRPKSVKNSSSLKSPFGSLIAPSSTSTSPTKRPARKSRKSVKKSKVLPSSFDSGIPSSPAPHTPSPADRSRDRPLITSTPLIIFPSTPQRNYVARIPGSERALRSSDLIAISDEEFE
ncbi:unnamed protein product [Ambrosiozyma monospora]|uniref:Unnamed protein product n=1 Tax=Ambrosiozyma monospora TaxID=43982 RepID=A0A9W6YYD3_AMBMO|nr:unnamed protein product [Ambrosiozyma monospora]